MSKSAMPIRSSDPVVSFDDEPLVLVDTGDTVIGYRSKAEAHDGAGMLHRAFSIFLFNGQGQLLLQQRSAEKRLWPMYWSNTCCSHPRRGETMDGAVERRLFEELNIRTPLRYLFKFIYRAEFGSAGTEHELCSVYVGHTDAQASVNSREIAATRYADPTVLDAELADPNTSYTPWLRLEWPRLRREHPSALTAP